MSLFRRIWLAVIALTVAAFAGSLLVNTYTARSYLEKQLYLKNADNATALALSMSQFREKDPVTVELLVAAQFDTGHYQSIQLADPTGAVIVERKQDVATDLGAPSWFVRLFPIQAKPGVAHVQDGWKQFGTITLKSHGRFAYEALWQGTLELLAWFVAGGILAGLLGTLMLRLITRPLDRVVDQAHAITERQFISIDVPKVPELRSVTNAMNEMVARVKQMFADEAARLESLRRQANHDAITGLPNRDFFIGRLRESLVSEDAAPHGLLAFIRLDHLDNLNNQLGHAETDKLLQQVGGVLEDVSASQAMQGSACLAARLRGSDFALLSPGLEQAQAFAQAISQALQNRVISQHPQLTSLYHVGVVHYRRNQPMDALLASVDQELAAAENLGGNNWHANDSEASAPIVTSMDAWRGLLTEALSGHRIKLASFPVRTASGGVIHEEGVVRLQAQTEGNWLSAGDFMHMAERLKLTAELDLQVVRLALAGLKSGSGEIAVNLSADTISDWQFHNRLIDLLRQQPSLCKRLWIEVAEHGVFRQVEAFRDLCRILKTLGCRVGIEHFGHRFDEIAKLSDLGLDYFKVDGSFIHDIQSNPGNQQFLKGVCTMAHSIGVSVIAESVRSAEELAVLPGLGFDGVTGPAVA